MIEGPHFHYDSAPGLFLGRSGRGPLEIVWDTNILLDYLEHGHVIWDEGSFDVADEDYCAELEALGLLINVWTRRDVRINILDRSITDAKKRLSAARMRSRATAVDEVAAALTLDVWHGREDEDEDEDYPWLGVIVPPEVLERIPEGADRELVAEAVERGGHVFLTRDGGVLRCRDVFKPHRLLLASPLDLLEELAACGALLSVLRPETMYWPLPDLQRLSHLIQALEAS